MESTQNKAPVSPIDTTAIANVLANVFEATRSARELSNFFFKNNQYLFEQIRHAQESMAAVSAIVEKTSTMTLPAIRKANEMAESLRNISWVIGPLYGIPESKYEEVIARPAASEVKEIIRKKLPAKKIVVSLKLPSDISWEHIKAVFIDGHNLFIELARYDLKYAAGFREMGMRNERTSLPNVQWKSFITLAEAGGVISWGNSKTIPHKTKKQKQLLADALKEYFGITSDPFITDRKTRSYCLKMQLSPEPRAVITDRSDPYGIQEELAEKSVSAFDPFENRQRAWVEDSQ